MSFYGCLQTALTRFEATDLRRRALHHLHEDWPFGSAGIAYLHNVVAHANTEKEGNVYYWMTGRGQAQIDH